MTTPPDDRDAQDPKEPISRAGEGAESPDGSPTSDSTAATDGAGARPEANDGEAVEIVGAEAPLAAANSGSASPSGDSSSAASPDADGDTSATATRTPEAGGTSSAPTESPEATAERRKDRTIGLLIVCCAFILTLGLSWWAKRTSAPQQATPPAPATTRGVAGWPDRVDPIANLRLAGSLTDRQDLRGIVITGVAPDGTVDMKLASSRVRYAFQSPPGEGPQPPRPPGTLPKRSYCGKQNVHIKREGIVADPDVTNYPCGMRLPDPLPEPRCGPKEVWKWAAEKKNVPTEKRRARIEYYRAKSGPAWRFELPGTRHRFSLYGDCARELKPVDAIGTVP